MAAIGVHLGCTSACVAVYKDGRADVVANDAGDRVTPAVVAYSENEEVVGLAAKQSRIRNISNTVMKVKQILGRSSDDPQAQKYITESKCLVIEKNGKLRYKIDTGEETKFVNPEDVARLIFSKMKETAHSVLGSDANDVVITVPFDFGEKQKNALGEAARAAGFNVLRLIHEPSAALLAYGIGQESPAGKSNILVFKLGGTSLSISVMEVNSGIYRVISTNTDDNIGGTQFTETLAQHLASEFQRSFKHDIRGNARAMMKLMNSADIAKHSLSTLGSANCFLDSLYEGQDFDCNVSRARFELLCSPLFNKCIEAIRALLQQSGFAADDINKVVLCGGSSRIPRLQQLIKDLFPAVELLNSIPPDEVIPIGAAIEAGILTGKENLLVEDSLKIECSAKDILVKGVDESGANSFTVLFPSGTPLPARRQHTLQAPGSISSVCLELYESEGKNSAKEENKFAQVILQDLNKKENGLHDILAVLTMKRDGSLHVTCTDQETGKCEAITIEDMEYYLVKWKGWPDSTNTWEPLQNLKCPLLLQQFSNDKHNYLSQVITSEEAERRGQLYDNKGITYLFDLDYESDEFTVDAARYGNVSHFVNHSCDPNLQVFNVFIDNLDTRLPRIALFSTRTINAGEELTFDYQMKGSGDISSDSIDYGPAKKRVRTVCKCGAVTCRGYLN